MNIRNEVVLVTGANRGLGKALVEEVVARGAKRVYATARDPERLANLVARFPERVVALGLDITDAKSLEAAAAHAPDVTVLVNNAGVLASYGILTSSANDIARDFATNTFGTLAATKTFLPALERAGARDRAAIVNVLSVVSLANMPGLGAYSASKAAAYSMTQALRADLRAKRVDVHAAFPGPIDTDMIKSFEMSKTRPEVVAAAILDGVERGDEEILPDPTSRELFATYMKDPKALERALAAM